MNFMFSKYFSGGSARVYKGLYLQQEVEDLQFVHFSTLKIIINTIFFR